MFKRHCCKPVATGIMTQAGFRKENLPPENWTILTELELFVCVCKKLFVAFGGRLIEGDFVE